MGSGIVGITIALVLLFFVGRAALKVSMPLVNADAIVLLAGSYEDRAPFAASIFLAGKTNKIILANDGVRSGWSRAHQRNLYAIERSEELLVKLGVPRQSIISLPFRKSGTVYDALAVREYVSKHDIRSILLVTSDYHSRRTLWIFQRVLRQLPVTIGIETAPSYLALAYFPKILLEYFKSVYYLIRFGWLDDIPLI
jgi:uncharacterized SAM-binding protein YcdF (DUF218 family)